MKVLHILDRSLPNISGYSLRSNYILKFQKQLGIEVVVITSPNQESLYSEEEIEEVTYYRTRIPKFLPIQLIRHNSLLKSIVFILCLKRRITEIVKKEKIDLLHAHSPILCGIPTLAVGKKYGIPVVYEMRALWEDAAVDLGRTKVNSLRYKLTRHYETKLLKQVNAIGVICQGLKNELILRHIPGNKIHVVSNGIDVNKFLPEPKDPALLRKYNLNGNLVFGFIGSFFAFEGLELFVKAALQLFSKGEYIKILIVGGGEVETKIMSLIKESKEENHFILTGKVPHDLINSYYSLVDVMVYPRINNRLTQLVTPLKPLEAMAMEKAIVASDVGGLKELIADQKTGLLFKAGNVSDLAEKMYYLAKNDKIRHKLGVNARECVIKNKNWADVTKKYLKIYTDILNNCKSNNKNAKN